MITFRALTSCFYTLTVLQTMVLVSSEILEGSGTSTMRALNTKTRIMGVRKPYVILEVVFQKELKILPYKMNRTSSLFSALHYGSKEVPWDPRR